MALQEMTANHFGTNYLRKLAPALTTQRSAATHPNSVYEASMEGKVCVWGGTCIYFCNLN